MRVIFVGIIAMLTIAAVEHSRAHGALVTMKFGGVLLDAGTLNKANDVFSGTFTYQTAVSSAGPADPISLPVQYLVISPSLAGTSWTFTVNSTQIAPFTVTGSGGFFAMGNNTSFGDRFTMTLQGPNTALPFGTLNFLQFDLQDTISNGQDLLSGQSSTDLPNLALAAVKNGRLFVNGLASGPSQISVTPTLLARIPESSPILFWTPLTAILLIAGASRVRRCRRT